MDTNSLNGARVKVRRLSVRDLAEIVRMVRQTQTQPWRGWEFLACVRPGEIVGCVAEARGRLVGLALCTPVRHKEENVPRGRLEAFFGLCRRLVGKHLPIPAYLNLLDVVVSGEWSRSQAERALLEELDKELRRQGNAVQMIVPETKLAVQLFLHEAGYQATRVLHDYFGDEDGYMMVRSAVGRLANAAADKRTDAAPPTAVQAS
jgi:ribosomal protein S18 acetylase RimI-like enzyme